MGEGRIYLINGPVVRATGSQGFMMNEMVKVGKEGLIGEIVDIGEEGFTVQVYESTTGLKVGEPIKGTGKLISAYLGPGLIGKIFDGIERPLDRIALLHGDFVLRGIEMFPLDENKRWRVEMKKEVGDAVQPGEVFALVQETPLFEHRLLVPPHVSGKIVEAKPSGDYKINDILLLVADQKGNVHQLTMYQEWPIRIPRPVKERLLPVIPLITGQRVIDFFFPLAKGGAAAIPGGFGTGKTVTQHQLAKWSDADVVVYIGCGERGNEMSDVLEEFPRLVDPHTGRPLMERTILIANTSNMPVSAREASIYTGITIAEYFRDMGYNVALMADSTSRWAEALRELSGRMEEMPAEEGYPAYLSSRLSEFYERAGRVKTFAGEEGSVTIIGAVSPPGGDFSEPVTRHTREFVRCFWALDRNLAYSRHYPAINWLTSYSDYSEDLKGWFKENIGEGWYAMRDQAMALLGEDDRLQQVIKLVGEDVLPDEHKLIVEVGRLIKIGFLQQNSFSSVDSFCSLQKQFKMMELILFFYERAKELIVSGMAISEIKRSDVYLKLLRMKEEIPNDQLEKFDALKEEVEKFFDNLQFKYKEGAKSAS